MIALAANELVFELLVASAASFPILVGIVAYHIGWVRSRRSEAELFNLGFLAGRRSERADQKLDPVL